MKLLNLLILAIAITSCSQTEKMDPWEARIAEQLKAERVEFYHHSSRTTANGVPSGSENYMTLDIYNSEVLNDMKVNKKLFKEKCDELRDAVMALPNLNAFPTFNDLRLQIIETHGFLIFSSKESVIVSYRVR